MVVACPGCDLPGTLDGIRSAGRHGQQRLDQGAHRSGSAYRRRADAVSAISVSPAAGAPGGPLVRGISEIIPLVIGPHSQRGGGGELAPTADVKKTRSRRERICRRASSRPAPPSPLQRERPTHRGRVERFRPHLVLRATWIWTTGGSRESHRHRGRRRATRRRAGARCLRRASSSPPRASIRRRSTRSAPA